MERLKIGEVADRTGMSKQAIRYFEEEGLIEEPYRSPTAGYRTYDEKVIYQIRFIQNAKELGFTLCEIKSLLSILEDQKQVPKKFAKKLSQILFDKQVEIKEKIEKLTAIKDLNDELIQKCPKEGTGQNCPCVEEIALEGQLREFLKPFHKN